MKKKLIVLISSIVVFIAGLTTILVLILDDNKPVDNPKIVESDLLRLEKPRNIVFQDYQLSWNPVNNAKNYLVYINKNEYIVNTNTFDMTNLVSNYDRVAVKTIGYDNYQDSVKSIELVFINGINDEEIDKINNSLKTFVKSEELDLNYATSLYEIGLKSTDVDKIINCLSSLIENNQKLGNYQKNDILNKIIADLVKISHLGINEFAVVKGISLIYNLYLKNIGHSEINTNLYYEKEELVENYQLISNKIDSISYLAYQDLTSLLHYINLYEKQFSYLVEGLSSMKNWDSVNSILSEVITLKSTISNMLLSEMPMVVEYDSVLNCLSDIYAISSSIYLEEQIKKEDLINHFKTIYTNNHHILGFINSLNDNDMKMLVTYVININKSIDQEEVKKLKDLFNENSDNYILKIIEEEISTLFDEFEITLNHEFTKIFEDYFENQDSTILINSLYTFFDVDKYFVLQESELDAANEYLKSLIPDSFTSANNIYEYLFNILKNQDLTKYVAIDTSNILSDVNKELLIDNIRKLINQEISEEEFRNNLIDIVDFKNNIKIDYRLLIKDIIEEIKLEAFDLGEFLDKLVNLDEFTIKSIFNLMGIESTSFMDINQFIENGIKKVGLTINHNLSIEKLEEVMNNVVTRIETQIPIIDDILLVVSLLSFMEDGEINFEEDFKDFDLENGFQLNSNIDILSVYNLIQYINNKYNAYNNTYKAPYEVIEINKEEVKNDLISGLNYLTFGKDANITHDFVFEAVNILTIYVKAIPQYKEYIRIYNETIDFFKLFEQEYNVDYFKQLYDSPELFNKRLDEIIISIDKLYANLIYLREHLPLRENLVVLKYFAITLCKFNEVDEIDKVEQFFDQLLKEYDSILNNIDNEYELLDQKEAALRRLLDNIHLLLDPIVEYIEEIKSIYYDDKIIDEDDIIDITSKIVTDKVLITSFYQEDLIITIGNDLDLIFGDEVIDFKALSKEICFYTYFYINRINANNVNSTSLKIVQELLDVVNEFKNISDMIKKSKTILDDSSLTIEEKQAKFNEQYENIKLSYESAKTSSLYTADLIDKFIMEGIDELKDENLEYLNRKDDFLIKDDLLKLFEITDKMINLLNYDFEGAEKDFDSYLVSLIEKVLNM